MSTLNQKSTTMATTSEQQAIDFLAKTNTKFKADYLTHDFYFDDDKETRDIYKITLTRNGKKWSFKFGQSINNSDSNTPPTAYDVLSCLQKYDIGSFENFCSEFGYDTDSKKAEKAYKAVLKEWHNVEKMFSAEEIEQLQEIQ